MCLNFNFPTRFLTI